VWKVIKEVQRVVLDDEIVFGDNQRPFVLIAGPCVLEGLERSLMIGKKIKEITERTGIPYIFKASFDKANRSSIKSYRGPGLEDGLEILKAIKKELQVPVLTDIHQPEQAGPVAEVVDIIQIPAFLCRQTDLLIAAAETGLVVNIKKGQFMAPWDMKKVVEKIVSTGNQKILLTERGISFGYNNLVVDMTSLPVMRDTGYPVVFDATHSVQRPGAKGETSGGDRQFVPYLSRAAAAVGIDALFMEVHDNPEEALSDGSNMLYLDDLEGLLEEVLAIDNVVKRN
jgi:2-dehydro-3-deoxyphosphooctonate aldolase (KDO 8-P synthase)